MNNVLIVLDHETRIPPFMVTLLLYAENRYNKVFYINTRKPQNYDLFEKTGVNIVYPSKWIKVWCAFLALIRFISIENIKQWFKCIKDKGFDLGYVRQLYICLGADIQLKTMARKILKENENVLVTVLAAWFAAAALAGAELKKQHPRIKAVSLAHSYEILTLRNPFIPYLYVEKKHKYLDGVYFICNTVREMYLEGVGGLPEYYLKKTHVNYLGSFKDHHGVNTIKPEEFHICTCSRMVPLKRLDVLLDALSLWDDGDIYWTHLGDGELETKIRADAEKVMASNPLVHIHFTGYVKNELVQQYYVEHPIDLFINLSSTEGLPISIMEAISYGLPVMATDVGGTSEIINDKFGFLIDSKINPEYIKSQIQAFKSLPEEKRVEMRKNAYQHWSECFDANKNMQSLFNAINSI